MLGLELVHVNPATHDADACLAIVSSKAGAWVGDGIGWHSEHSPFADEGNAVLLDEELFCVRARFDNNAASGFGIVDDLLNTLTRLDAKSH